MIWYATYPRCGNSYAENVLKAAGYVFIDRMQKAPEDAQICKTHDLKTEGKAVVQIRHPLDVFCSMKNYYGYKTDEILKRMENYGKFCEFYENRGDVVFVRYEYALNYPDAVINAVKQFDVHPIKDAYQLPTFAEWREIIPNGRRRLQKGVANRYKEDLGDDKDKVVEALMPLCEQLEYKVEL